MSQKSEMMLIIYDLTNDGDDEIRHTGAESALNMLSDSSEDRQRNRVPTPPVARQMICSSLMRTARNSKLFVLELLKRCTGTSLDRPQKVKPVEALLDEMSNERDVLFAVEKQNLYVDAVRDAKNWSRALKNVEFRCLGREVLAEFTGWCLDGLTALKTRATAERDGPLGWSSKSEVFSLGMQVIYATDVLVNWRSKSKWVPVKGCEVRQQLLDLYQIGDEMELHCLWLREVETILKRSYVQKVACAAKLVEIVSCTLN